MYPLANDKEPFAKGREEYWEMVARRKSVEAVVTTRCGGAGRGSGRWTDKRGAGMKIHGRWRLSKKTVQLSHVDITTVHVEHVLKVITPSQGRSPIHEFDGLQQTY
jgi:hypothetical protein